MKLKKADEMEMAINYQSIRLSYLFVTISLFTWMIFEIFKNRSIPYTIFAIVAVQNIIFFGSKLYLTRKMTSGINEKQD